MEDKNEYYSRSVLATKLAVTLKELTHAMIEAGWLEQKESNNKANDGKQKEWYLTNKGEFEGGIYRESKKFGKYIVWPNSVLSHGVIKELQQTTISASKIGAAFDISPTIMNKLFADLGWIKSKDKGWYVTEQGVQHGAIQQTSDETGIPYVVWSRSILDNAILQAQIGSYKGDAEFTLQRKWEGKTLFKLLNGLWVDNASDLLIGNYLYVCGLTFAYQRAMSFNQHPSVAIDFYLPSDRIVVLVNREKVNPSELAQQIERQQAVEQCGVQSVVLSTADIQQIDKVLPKRLLPLGLSLY